MESEQVVKQPDKQETVPSVPKVENGSLNESSAITSESKVQSAPLNELNAIPSEPKIESEPLEQLKQGENQTEDLVNLMDKSLTKDSTQAGVAQVKEGILTEEPQEQANETILSSSKDIISGENEPRIHVMLKDQPFVFNSLPGDYNTSSKFIKVPIKVEQTIKTAIGWEDALNKDMMSTVPIQDVVNDKVNHWRNVTVIYVAIFLTWIGVILGGGLVWCLIVVGCCSNYYQNTIERYRKRARDDAIRELWSLKLESETETVAWLNNFLDKFWVIYEPGLSSTIKSIVDVALEFNKPAFLDSLSLTEFRLGNKAPRINSVKTHSKTKSNSVLMDWDIEFQPNKDMNMTLEQVKNQINPKVVLQIRVGKGMVGAGLPVLVEDFSIRGNLRVRINFGEVFPHVEVVTLQFLQRPDIDYVLKPVGGETFGFDIANVPGLSSFIRDQIHATLEGMMYAPNMFSLNIQQMMTPVAKDKYLGILKVKVCYARDLKFADGSGDPYVLMSTGKTRPTYRTTTKNQTYSPDYNETFEIVLLKEDDAIRFTVFDFNSFRKDFECGSDYLNLEVFKDKPIINGLQLALKREQLYVGNLTLDCQFIPADVEYLPKLNNDKSAEPLPVELPKSGILTFTLHQIKELDASKSLIGKFTPYCSILINGKEKLQTSKKKRNNNPIYEETIEYFTKDISNTNISLIIKDDRGMSVDPIIAKWSHNADKLILNNGWYPLNNVASGKVKVTTKFYPLKAQASNENSIEQNAFGYLKLFILEAPKIKFNSPKSEVYIKVKYQNKAVGNTKVLKSDLIPRWDQQFDLIINNEIDSIYFELIEIINNEAYVIGKLEYNISDLYIIREDSSYISKGLVNKWSSLNSNNSRIVGALHFGACLFLADKEMINNALENEKAIPAVEPSNSDKEKDKDKQVKVIQKSALEVYPNLVSGILCLAINNITGIKSNNLNLSIILEGLNTKMVMENIPSKSTDTPTWNINKNVFVESIQQHTLIIILKEGSEIIAKIEVPVQQLLNYPIKDKFDLIVMEDVNLNLAYNFTPIEFEPLNGIDKVLSNGKLEVTIVEARDLVAKDSSGTSDPYIKVKLNDNKVYKTQTYKKNLNPKINETFSVPMLDIYNSNLLFEMFDWNKVHASESLGYINVNLDDPKFSIMTEANDEIYDLQGIHKGQLRLIINYVPCTLSDEELNLAVGYLNGAKKHIRSNSVNSDIMSIDQSTMASSMPNTVNNVVTQETLLSQENLSEMKAEATGLPGKVKITIIGAEKLMAADKGGTSDPYVKVKKDGELLHQTRKIKKTLEPVWNEPFTLDLKDGSPYWIQLIVMDHNRIQSDVPLGNTHLNIWDHFGSDLKEGDRVEFFTNPLNGGEPGKVHLALEYLG